MVCLQRSVVSFFFIFLSIILLGGCHVSGEAIQPSQVASQTVGEEVETVKERRTGPLRPWQPECSGCVHRESRPGCPNPEACGYLPIRCVFCLDGVSMPNCPRPDWCGYAAVGLGPRKILPQDEGEAEATPQEDENGEETEADTGEEESHDSIVLLDSSSSLSSSSSWTLHDDTLRTAHDHMHGDCAMAMYFNTMERDFCLLFKSWKITSAAGFFGAALFVFSLSFCREVLDVYSTKFRRQRVLSGGPPRAMQQPRSDDDPHDEDGRKRWGPRRGRRRSQGAELSGGIDSEPLLRSSGGEDSSTEPATATLKFRVEGLTCARCEDTLSRGIPQSVDIRGIRVSFVSWEAGELWITCGIEDLPTALHLVPGAIADLGYTSLPAQDDTSQSNIASLRLNVIGMTEGESAAQVAYTLEQIVRGRVEVSVHHSEAWVPVGGPDSKDLAVLIPSLEDSLRQLGYESSVEAVAPLLAPPPAPIDLWSQAVHSFLHSILLLVAYILMLVVMTYNVMLCICLLLGCALGHYVSHYHIFAGKVIQTEPTIADHCCQDT